MFIEEPKLFVAVNMELNAILYMNDKNYAAIGDGIFLSYRRAKYCYYVYRGFNGYKRTYYLKKKKKIYFSDDGNVPFSEKSIHDTMYKQLKLMVTQA